VIGSGQWAVRRSDATSKHHLVAGVRPFTLFPCLEDQMLQLFSYEMVGPQSSWIPERLYRAAPPIFTPPILVGMRMNEKYFVVLSF
jgi:hypothetical protein